jgi:hypothetical protein
MNSDYIQFIRYKLKKRLQRLNTSDNCAFHWALVYASNFLQESEITKGILDDLERRHPECEEYASLTLNLKPQVGHTEGENAAICHWVIKKCGASKDAPIEMNVSLMLAPKGTDADRNDAFRAAYVEPLFDYIEEHIDDKRITLTLLRRYKHRCEWFRSREEDPQSEEAHWAYDLYKYLHDQGLQFHLEPSSASGRIDLISSQTGTDRLVADVKVFDPDGSRGVNYICKGFRQLYDYTKDYNESFGYLVIFKLCEADLSIATSHQEASIPFFVHNNKTIFIIIVDICKYSESASQRGRLRAYEITVDQVIEALVSQER